MSDFLQDGMDWLAAGHKRDCPLSATYTRGATTITLTISPGRTIFASNRQGGARIEFGEIDFLIDVADLVIGSATAPAEGDRLAVTIRGIVYAFEIMPVSGEPAWRYSDQYRTRFRIHCKEVG